jgi:hypothetical protein
MRGDTGWELSSQSEEPVAAYRSEFRVGGIVVKVGGRYRSDVTLVPSLGPFRVGTPVSDINIQVEWVDSL